MVFTFGLERLLRFTLSVWGLAAAVFALAYLPLYTDYSLYVLGKDPARWFVVVKDFCERYLVAFLFLVFLKWYPRALLRRDYRNDRVVYTAVVSVVAFSVAGILLNGNRVYIGDYKWQYAAWLCHALGFALLYSSGRGVVGTFFAVMYLSVWYELPLICCDGKLVAMLLHPKLASSARYTAVYIRGYVLFTTLYSPILALLWLLKTYVPAFPVIVRLATYLAFWGIEEYVKNRRLF